MGLAPYGRPTFADAMRKIVRLLPDGGFQLDLKFFRHLSEDVPYQWAGGCPEFGDLFSPALHQRTGLTDLALAGGCAMNSVANGKVRRMTPFRRVYVQAAAGDAGGAIGAAFAVWHKLGGKRTFVMD